MPEPLLHHEDMSRDDPAAPLRHRLVLAGALMVGIYGAGTAGYYLLGEGRWSLGACAYMTVVTLTTVGYAEVLPDMARVPYARLFTGVLLVLGVGIALYAISVLTSFIMEGQFLNLQRRRKMRKRIQAKEGHIVVCGAGRTGVHVIEELLEARWPLVVIECDAEQIERAARRLGRTFDHIVGDATDDEVLKEAGIGRARGIVAALPDDKDNLFIVVTARGLNPGARIVAQAVDPRAVRKLEVAGADKVVLVNRIGGYRLAAEMVRPNVVDFIEGMTRARDRSLRFEELVIPAGSELDGKSIAESGVRMGGNVLIVALRAPGSERYVYSPRADARLEAGMTLIVLGETEAVARLRASPLFARGGEAVNARPPGAPPPR